MATAEGAKRFYDGWIWLSLQGWGTSILAGGFTLAMMVLAQSSSPPQRNP